MLKVFDDVQPVTDPVPAQPDLIDNSLDSLVETVDHAVDAALARFTGGISLSAVAEAYMDWILHLGLSPGKRMQLVGKAMRKSLLFANHTLQSSHAQDDVLPCIEPLPGDSRFADPAWQRWPYNLIYQAFLLNQQWWHNATTGIAGVAPSHERFVEFGARQWLDVFSPANNLLTNPVAMQRCVATGGASLIEGLYNFADDAARQLRGGQHESTDGLVVGRDLATAPGKVVFRNQLIELIQYAPTTENVRPEPVLIVPAWIMKYYVLDLSPRNSMVRHLTSQGFTVFMMSWHNPGAEDRDFSMEDYRQSGIMAALNAIGTVLPGAAVHAAGYCIGGTLLSIAAAAMARDGDRRLKSVTLLAAQVDFSEAGELMLFINAKQIQLLEDMMQQQGYLDSAQMGGAFQMLRSKDLVWSRMVHDYLMGQRDKMSDLMAWNADGTRLPYHMHSQYLRELLLENRLSRGLYLVENRPIALADISVPIFAVGTEKDHVAPWRSVYKIHRLSGTEVTFVLTNGGHNAGIVSEPGHPHRHYRISTRAKANGHDDPDTWRAAASEVEGSWWEAWTAWLGRHSGEFVKPPEMGAPERGFPPICDAPGTYVFEA